jgi:hypothetical protein
MRYRSRNKMLAAFGPYAPVFDPIGEDTTPYLSLLGLDPQRSLAAVEIVRFANRKENAGPARHAMLTDDNWRPHVVGAVATYFDPSAESIMDCWIAIDAGSWVTPQLAAVVSAVDPNFAGEATTRLEDGIRVVGNGTFGLSSALELHSAQGPAGTTARSAKTAASLLALLPKSDPSSALTELVEKDIDNSGEIATRWLAAIKLIPPTDKHSATGPKPNWVKRLWHRI